ncbi:MAG: cation:proton antiporter [Opitutaceae bacterium]|nr:cation:proton antiporter [Opitutaceae bacterium]
MNAIEIIILLILLFMGVPDLCRLLGRPSLAFPIFVLFGLIVAPVANDQVRQMLVQAGQVGFLLLLFEVGLEIELPRFRDFLPSLRRAASWALLQYPVILALGHLAGLQWLGSFIACAAFTGCSVGMGYLGWKNYPGLNEEPRRRVLLMMLSLEIIAIVLLSVETALYEKGLSWLVVLKLAGIGTTIYLISRFADKLEALFDLILRHATHWRMHLIVLLVLVVCAIGERLGLSGTKTAFFLGLFLSRITHDGHTLEHFIAPISHKFLIPIFFFALGLQIEWQYLFSITGLVALGAAALLLGWRLFIHRRIIPTGGDDRSFLLLCPNLTIVALASQILITSGNATRAASWMVLVGLFMTISAILLLPKATSAAPDHTS